QFLLIRIVGRQRGPGERGQRHHDHDCRPQFQHRAVSALPRAASTEDTGTVLAQAASKPTPPATTTTLETGAATRSATPANENVKRSCPALSSLNLEPPEAVVGNSG